MIELSKISSHVRGSRGQLSLEFWFRRMRTGATQRLRIVEMLVCAWLLPIGGLLLFTGNPTGLTSGFPWVIAGPLIFSARYGTGWAIACSLLTGSFLLLPFSAYTSLFSEHLTLAVGTLFMSLVVGDATSAWRTRSQKADAENQYLRHRLKEFSTDYHVLKVSHGLLEEYMAGQRLSLREALQRLQPALTTSNEGIKAGNELMAVFSQFCSIQVAGLYAMSNSQKIDSTPIATHGELFDLPLFDPLLRAALKTQEVASIKLESLAEKHHENSLLAVVPLVDTDGHLHGVLAIRDMHFMAFQQQNLNLLALLGYYVGNQLTRSKGYSQSRAQWFLAELETALRFAHSHNTTSALIVMKFKQTDKVSSIAQFVSTGIRSLDASWLLDSEDHSPVVSLLLPLMSETQCQAFMHRLDMAIREQFSVSLESVLSSTRTRQIDSSDSLASSLEYIGELTGIVPLKTALQAEKDSQAQTNVA